MKIYTINCDEIVEGDEVTYPWMKAYTSLEAAKKAVEAATKEENDEYYDGEATWKWTLEYENATNWAYMQQNDEIMAYNYTITEAELIE